MAQQREQKNVRPDMAALSKDSAFYQTDEHRSERQKLSEMNVKQKVVYIAEYYGRTIVIVTALVAVLVFLVLHFVFQKEIVLEIMAVNTTTLEASPADEEAYYASVLSACGMDPEEVTVGVTSNMGVSPNVNDGASMNVMQAIQSRFLTCSVDVFFSDEDLFYSLAEFDYLTDLRFYLSDEVLAELEDSLVYVVSVETGTRYPAGICLKDNAWLERTGWYEGEAIIGIAAGTKHEDTALALLAEVLEVEEL